LNRSLYGERDYAFGQLILTLRTHIGLTQAGLAEVLGISRRAVAQWEAGSSYPKAHYLKHVITLGREQRAFAAGREEEEIRALWKAAHQKVLLDDVWLQELLNRPAPSLAGLAGEPISISGAGPGSAAPGEEGALWTVPSARNPHFTGRDDLLSELTARLSPPAPGQPTTIRQAALTQAQVIKGLGGIGKTQTAVEYAYRSREQGRYTHTLWITASSEEAILMSFAALAELLPTFASTGETDQRKLVAAVIRWLEQCPRPWLLIVDNADDLSLVQPYLPVQGNGSVLLTTRASAVGWLASSLEVDTMGLIEGTELLLRRAGRFAHATDSEINEATNLVVALAQFPLALDQAGAYLEETGCSLADYLQLYQTHRHVLLARRGRQASQYPASVATTWSRSFEYVEQTNPAAAELLRLCAFLAPDGIPEELLTAGAPQWPSALQEAAADRFRFNQALETLLAFSLVKRLAEDRLLSVHRLVQAVQVERMTPEERRQWAERLVRAVNTLFPRDPEEVTSWPACQRYLDQVQACDRLIQQQHLLLPEAAEVLDRAGTYLRGRALYPLAEPLYRRALHLWEQLVNEAHPNRARSMDNLAQLYVAQGEYAAAEALYQQMRHIGEQQVGSEYPLLAEALRGLGHIYVNQGKYAQAKPLYQRALHLGEQQAGDEHPLLVSILTGLAFAHTQQGERAEAELLYLRAVRIRERQFGSEHVQVSYPLLGMAHNFTQKREYAQAEPLYQRVLRIREQQVGSEHPLVAIALHELAKLYVEQAKYALAEPLFQRALSIREQQLGSENVDVADTLRGLADLYAQQGEYERAEPLFQRALRIREQQFGVDGTPVSGVLLGLARLSFHQGEDAQAEVFFKRALHIREKQYGPEHFQTAEVLHDFAGLQQAQGQTQEAARLYKRALVIREHAFGIDSPVTIDTRERLHNVLVELGHMQETVRTEG
jgi:tetratricopeptide (TPR) repeat protein/transcriptional regulator with XRE-family HTH domain